MKNIYVIEKLVRYYLDQPPEVVARILANYQIDMHRLYLYDELGEQEQDCLLERMRHNSSELIKFLEGNESPPMRVESVQNWFEVPGPEEIE